MKTYTQAVARLGDAKYHNIMGGGSGQINTDNIAWVYEVSNAKLGFDISAYVKRTYKVEW